MLLTNTQASRLCKTISNGSSPNIKLSKTQLHKKVESEGFLGKLLRPLLKIDLPLIENLLKPLAKNLLISLWLTAAAAATDSAIHKEREFVGILLGTLGASLFRNLLTGKDTIRSGEGKIKADQDV